MASTKPRSYDEYTIGWVCALPKEQTAATAMLDDIHPAVRKPSTDPNNYTLGSIGKHNVVIACLPKGQVGTNSAATVATRMVSTFSRIKFGLMVGIGGGIPPKVRLGDVVVGTPVGQFPGVVQWDMGKAKENGSFERTGSLNNPPASLLTALSKLETEHELLDSLEDILFHSDYNHVNESGTGDEDEGNEKESCTFCDKARIVKRKPRDARVHYGLIASGNQVIKDAIIRDKLNNDLGGHVLCVEMEAAGLVNFPCVVIRGICDYADSHKNKNWREHAAAMAAALAKELLQYVQPDDVKREPLAKDTLSNVYNIVSKTREDVAQITSIIEREGDLKIFDWITSKDYSLQQNKYIEMHQKGTGRWLLDSAEFITWAETEKQTLFCPGMPGAGKTILTAIVVNNLISRFAHDPLLKQLVRGQSSIPASLKNLYDQHKGKGTRPSLDEILKVLQYVIGVYCSRAFIIIDALDECQASENCRMSFIKRLLDFQDCGANIFATSRSIPDITDKFEGSIRLEIRASDDDIRRYVKDQISQGGSAMLRDMQAEASTGIMSAADGMFLLAKLDLDSLLDVKLPRDIRAKLKNLPKGSKAYSHAYETIMKRIEHQGPGSVKLAKAVLSWITCAKRPLTISELRHALTVEIGESRLNEKYLPQAQDLVSVCVGLVTVDEDSDIIRLFHYTAQEYFQQTQQHWFPDAEDEITSICVTYLSFDVFEAGLCQTDATFEERLRSYQLYDYAAHEWGHHAREAMNLDPQVLDFLQHQSKVEASSQALFAVKESRKPHYSQNVPKKTAGLHLVAYFGIEKAVRIPLDLYGWDPEDSYSRTPLSWAAENGHEAIVRLLLNKGANPKAMDDSGLTPLSWATLGRHEAIVRLLNTSKQEFPSLPTTGGSASNDSKPAVVANADGKLQKFNLMLKSVQMIRRNEQNEKEQQLLSQKTESISIQLRQIKEQQSKVEEELRKLKMRKTFLAEEENDKTGEIHHLDKVQVEFTGKSEQLSKQWIYTQTRLDELRQIDGYEHESKLEKIRDSTLFRWAVEDGYAEIVELLLNGGTNTAVVHKGGWMPLHAAASKGHVDVVRLLLDKGKLDVGAKNQDGWTALQLATERGHWDIVQLLPKQDVNIGATMSQCQQTFEGHNSSVFSVAFSHDSKLPMPTDISKLQRLGPLSGFLI
ncbi:ankyrin repeats (3 copies) domain-containing protein [Trichoderma breve]|uniref:Ankyrin repeats (3 copies) domain-containing protein n=1 Tax=Trichoderma breve TaxID=2034170 RepID=A0A9W9BAX9_9HYPO|nr:ankyrin repeats (3 copies) domain-containing protein [Trichoderma breve]KAJ4859780.1 ankyrin repeats (3 copies) domain-containing protein [Trichoderma breve]